jgi:peptidyl-prolyl cis-trans isomerase SurA
MDRRSAGTGARAASNANSLDATPQNLIVTQTLARHILIRQRQGLQDADVERRLTRISRSNPSKDRRF